MHYPIDQSNGIRCGDIVTFGSRRVRAIVTELRHVPGGDLARIRRPDGPHPVCWPFYLASWDEPTCNLRKL